MSIKRLAAITIAAAGTLTLATATSAVIVTLPSTAAPAWASTTPAAQTAQAAPAAQPAQLAVASVMRQVILFDRMRTILGVREQQAAARQAAARQVPEVSRVPEVPQAAQRTPRSAQQVSVTTPSGSPRQIAGQLLSQFGWPGSQFSCLDSLWERESGWDLTAENPSSGAYGIPQAMPGSMMASAGAGWQTDAAIQIRWGLAYIQGRYGSPCGAWAHEESDGWY
jgi:hypothetical protein